MKRVAIQYAGQLSKPKSASIYVKRNARERCTRGGNRVSGSFHAARVRAVRHVEHVVLYGFLFRRSLRARQMWKRRREWRSSSAWRFHSYSPCCVSNVPICSDLSRSVKRGPSSCSRAATRRFLPSPFSSKI